MGRGRRVGATFRRQLCSVTVSSPRTALVASVFALAVPVTSCSVDVYHPDVDRGLSLPVYPDARPVESGGASDATVSFTGSFAHTNIASRAFESDDTPGMILDFYRRTLRPHGAVVECRGTINVRRRRGVETLACLERPESQSIQLAGGVGGKHSVVVVTAGGAAAQFTVLDVHTGG